MCLGGGSKTTPPPPPPPPPPPVLEQDVPKTAAPTGGEVSKRKALGSKKYRTSSLGIDDSSSSGAGTGLGITQ